LVHGVVPTVQIDRSWPYDPESIGFIDFPKADFARVFPFERPSTAELVSKAAVYFPNSVHAVPLRHRSSLSAPPPPVTAVAHSAAPKCR